MFEEKCFVSETSSNHYHQALMIWIHTVVKGITSLPSFEMTDLLSQDKTTSLAYGRSVALPMYAFVSEISLSIRMTIRK
jgi:hypothetical protein